MLVSLLTHSFTHRLLLGPNLNSLYSQPEARPLDQQDPVAHKLVPRLQTDLSRGRGHTYPLMIRLLACHAHGLDQISGSWALGCVTDMYKGDHLCAGQGADCNLRWCGQRGLPDGTGVPYREVGTSWRGKWDWQVPRPGQAENGFLGKLKGAWHGETWEQRKHGL